MSDVMISIKDTLNSTPWWIYLLFFVLLQRGVNASKTRIVSLKKLAVLPLVLSVWSIWELLSFGGTSASLFFVFIIAFAIGCGIGWAIVCKKNIKVVNQQEGLLKMPGSWATLLIIMVIFITKYAFGFLMAVDAHVMHQAVPLFSMFAISAVLSGTLCGRLLNYVYRLRTTKKLKQDREYSKA